MESGGSRIIGLRAGELGEPRYRHGPPLRLLFQFKLLIGGVFLNFIQCHIQGFVGIHILLNGDAHVFCQNI